MAAVLLAVFVSVGFLCLDTLDSASTPPLAPLRTGLVVDTVRR